MSEQSDALVPLSVLVPVKNEAANVRDCLASVSFAQEIVVVDSGSTDGTQAVAEAAGARIVQFVWNGKFPRKKNWALQNVRWQHEWVLILDADERITPALEREITQAIRRTDADGFYLNRRFWFLGGWINIVVIFRVGICACSGIGWVGMNRSKSTMISRPETMRSMNTYCSMAGPST